MKNQTEKKKKMPKRLEDQWVAYLIDVLAGPSLMMIAPRFPDRALKLQQILIRMVKDMYAKKGGTFRDDPEQFVNAAAMAIQELVSSFVVKNLTMLLIEGMPKVSQIVPGSNVTPFPGNPMGGPLNGQ